MKLAIVERFDCVPIDFIVDNYLFALFESPDTDLFQGCFSRIINNYKDIFSIFKLPTISFFVKEIL